MKGKKMVDSQPSIRVHIIGWIRFVMLQLADNLKLIR
ncbi:hypothetical protein POKO110462_15330 [Pontibacter korlensis]